MVTTESQIAALGLACIAVYAVLIVLAVALPADKKRPRLKLCKHAAISAVATAFVLLAVLAILMWISVLKSHSPLMDGTRGAHWFRYMFALSIYVAIQITILLVATCVVSIARGRFSLVGGILSGIVICVVVVAAIFMGVMQRTDTPAVLTWMALPVLVSVFQFLPGRKKRNPSNNELESIVA